MEQQKIETVEVPAVIIEEDGTRTETTALIQVGPESTPAAGDTLIDEGEPFVVYSNDAK